MIPEVAEKMGMIRQLSAQIALQLKGCELNERGHRKFTPTSARWLQQLQQRRAELLKTLPPLQIVSRTEDL